MFSSAYAGMDDEARRSIARVALPAVERVRELAARGAAGERLALGELAELLEIGSSEDSSAQFDALRKAVLQRWRPTGGSTVRYVTPIYVSSHCVDECPYCNFSATRRDTVRHRLTRIELDIELQAAIANGARVVELVYATDPDLGVNEIAAHIRQAAEAVDAGRDGAGVLLCTEYLTERDYKQLREAGLQGIVQWDETLDEKAFAQWHATSPRKREFRLRMDNHDRALRAGLQVAAGALFGLADYRYDALMQIGRARYVESEYGRGPFVMGTARLKSIGGRELKFATMVSDRAYETALLVYKLAVPEAGRWLQTRETFAMNQRNLLDGDVFTYRCGEVQPGGYTQIQKTSAAGAQFGVNELERESVERELSNEGIGIDYRWMHGAPWTAKTAVQTRSSDGKLTVCAR